MVSLGERLSAAMNDRNATVSALAKAVGMSYQGIKKIVDGKTKEIDASNCIKISSYLQISSEWLSTGTGSRTTEVASAPSQPVASDDLLLALAVVAKAIEKADEMTRLSVEPLLSLLAREPSQSVNIAHRVHKLLTVESDTSSVVDDAWTGLRKIGLSTPKSMGQADGRSDSTQRQSGTK